VQAHVQAQARAQARARAQAQSLEAQAQSLDAQALEARALAREIEALAEFESQALELYQYQLDPNEVSEGDAPISWTLFDVSDSMRILDSQDAIPAATIIAAHIFTIAVYNANKTPIFKIVKKDGAMKYAPKYFMRPAQPLSSSILGSRQDYCKQQSSTCLGRENTELCTVFSKWCQ
jgi:hypothetical protein